MQMASDFSTATWKPGDNVAESFLFFKKRVANLDFYTQPNY